MKTNEKYALVVEDERSWQQIISELLTDEGMLVEIAGNLETALNLVRSRPHRLAVVDLSLESNDPKNQDGLCILEALNRHDPGCAKLLLTGFATVELAVSVLKDYNAFDCLRKETFNRSRFRELICSAVNAPDDRVAAVKTGAAVAEDAAADEDRLPETGNALVVEDDDGWRSILSELLIDNGYQVCLCTSYGEALGHLRRKKFRLAVIDLSLSGDNIDLDDWSKATPAEDLEGYRLLASTRAAGVPTIVVSGVSNPSDIEKAYQEQGVFAFMEKHSFDRRTFLLTVQEAQISARQHRELDALTDRERQVLDLLAQGMTNKEIAETLFVSNNTVKRHLKAIFGKLDIHTRSAAAAKALGADGVIHMD